MTAQANMRSVQMEITNRQQIGENLFRATIAVNDKARQPPILRLSGLDTRNYERNPVVMFAHDTFGGTGSQGLPIGKTVRLNRPQGVGGPIEADFEFDVDDDFARLVKSKWEKGFIRAASISWIPTETELTGEGPVDVRSDMLEWSIVSVPADADAVRDLEQAYFRSVSGLAEAETPVDTDDDVSEERDPESLTEKRVREIFNEEFVKLSVTDSDEAEDTEAGVEDYTEFFERLGKVAELVRSTTDDHTN